MCFVGRSHYYLSFQQYMFQFDLWVSLLGPFFTKLGKWDDYAGQSYNLTFSEVSIPFWNLIRCNCVHSKHSLELIPIILCSFGGRTEALVDHLFQEVHEIGK